MLPSQATLSDVSRRLAVVACCLTFHSCEHNTNWRKQEAIPHDSVDNSKAGTNNDITERTVLSNGREVLKWWDESSWALPRQTKKIGHNESSTATSYYGPPPAPKYPDQPDSLMYPKYWYDYPVGSGDASERTGGGRKGSPPSVWPPKYNESKPNEWNDIDFGAALKPVDMSLKLHYGVQYVGNYLMNGNFAGDLIAQATFEANFINDVSSSLELHDSRIQVINITMGDFHSSWMNKVGAHSSVAGKGAWRVETPGDARQTSTYGRYKKFDSSKTVRDHDNGEYFGDNFDGSWDMHAHYKDEAHASVPEYDLDSYDLVEHPQQGFVTSYEGDYTTHTYEKGPSATYQQDVRDRERVKFQEHEEHRLEGAIYQGTTVKISGTGTDADGKTGRLTEETPYPHRLEAGTTYKVEMDDMKDVRDFSGANIEKREDIVGGVNPSWWQGGKTEFGAMGLGERSVPFEHYQETPNVIVHFRLLPATEHDPKSTVLAIRDLNAQVQNSTSRLYDGHVTFQTLPDSTWGLKVKNWDSSIRLTYSHKVIGELNSVNRRHFEYYFVDDIATALDVSHHRVQVLFITPGDKDPAHHGSVLVKFRIHPPEYTLLMEHGTTSGERQEWAPGASNGTDWGTGYVPEGRANAGDRENYSPEPASQTKEGGYMDGDQAGSKETDDQNVRTEPRKDGWGVWGYTQTSSAGERSILEAYDLLAAQLDNSSSKLYSGNVTQRADRAYGISGPWGMTRRGQAARTHGPPGYLVRDTLGAHWSLGGDHPDDGAGRSKEYRNRAWTSDAYVRCKRTQRCARAWAAYHTQEYSYNFTAQAYVFGRHRKIDLFSEFENWRSGTHGWTWRAQPGIANPVKDEPNNKPEGAHFSTFDFPLNHWKPEYSDNKGLVLNAMHQAKQVADKRRIVAELQKEVDFLEEYIVTARDGINGDFLGQHPLSGEAGYQSDHPHNFDRIRARYKRDEKVRLRDHEMLELDILHNSQCTNLDCTLLFNTSSLWLSGAVEAKGYVSHTEAGTEVAVWNFETVEVGPEVNITIVGTRAFVLLSRSGLTLNTTLHTSPGSLGGFPGGGEIFHDDHPVGLDYNCDDSDKSTPAKACTALKYPGYKAPHSLLLEHSFPGYKDTQHRPLLDGTTQAGYPGYGNTTAWMHSDTANGTWKHDTPVENYPPIPDASGSPDYGKTEQVHRPKTVNTQYWKNYLGVHSTAKTNVNGPGSGNVRVYQHTITSSGDDVDEVQTITTSAQAEQSLGGCFILKFVGHCHRNDYATCVFPEERTQCIPHDASADEVRTYIEGGLPRAGKVHVKRAYHQKNSADWTGAYVWTVRFHTAVGNVAQLSVVNQLTGLKAGVATNTIQEGNSVMGAFTLSFLGGTTRSLPYNVEGPAMAAALITDIENVLDAMVVRTDPTSLCDHGLCDNGPSLAGGYTWTLITTTQLGNQSPSSPTHPDYSTVPVAAPLIANMNSAGAGLSLTGTGVSLVVKDGHSETHVLHLATMHYGQPIPYGMSLQTETVSYIRNMMASHSRRCRAISSEIDDERCEQLCFLQNAICPRDHCRCDRTHTFYSDNDHLFSLAFGGMGGGYGGRGGVGHGKNAPGRAYGDAEQSDLLGGSGGALGGERPFEIRPFPDPIGKGGAGAGAIELVAANDLIVGSHGVVRVDGEAGHQGHRAGGGGSGGAILLSAGGVIVQEGLLTASGGRGGHGRGDMNRGGGAGGGGRIAMYANSISGSEGEVVVDGGKAGNCTFPYTSCGGPGAKGTTYQRARFGHNVHYMVDRPGAAPGAGRGAAQTNHSLLLYGGEEVETPSGVTRESPFPWNGPEHILDKARPERVSFYVRFGETYTGGKNKNKNKNGDTAEAEAKAEDATQKSGWDTQFVLHGDPEHDRSFPDGHEFHRQSPISALVGVSVMDGAFRHDANFVDTPGSGSYDFDHQSEEDSVRGGEALGARAGVFERNLRSRSWYKVDMFIKWRANSSELHSYDIRLNDVLKVQGATFNGSFFSKVGLYKRQDAGAVRYDEIYLGYDDTMRFQCPRVGGDGVHIDRPVQRGWGVDALGKDTEWHEMSRHESHLSRRKKYQHNNGGLLEGDGYEHRSYHSDIHTKTPDGDHHAVEGGVFAGALTFVPRGGQGAHTKGSRVHDDLLHTSDTRASPDGATAWSSDGADDGRSKQRESNGGPAWSFTDDGDPDPNVGVYYWFADHDNKNKNSLLEEDSDGSLESTGLVSEGGAGHGAVMACSTTDFVTWHNEGTMLRYANLTDMVQGRTGPFIAQQPKVLYNNHTDRYVMWLQMDNANHTLGLAAVAVSEKVNGPFELVRSFYPDGNETHDQTVFMGSDGVTAYLARTYYMDVEYIMPEPVMQPLWESVKFPEGHKNQQSSFTFDGSVNFGLNYHRAKYHIGYDDFHDVYIQRWRNEDNKWEVVCVNSVGSQRSILIPGQYADVEKTIYQSNVCNKGNEIINSKYITTNERKIIVGQGDTGSTSLRGPVLSRFKDPTDPLNNYWKAGSVPRVKAQPWGLNYIDGECGRRDFTQGMSRLDADLPYRDLSSREECTNVVDNAVHATPPDMLVGVPVVVETRRAKYVAVSKLTDDYLDTAGITLSFEGEMEDEADLLTLMQGRGQFGWGVGDEVKTTFHDQVHDPEFGMETDWDDRFYQYQDNFNDRARDSPSCVNNGECPVNFADQVRQPLYKVPPKKKKGVRP